MMKVSLVIILTVCGALAAPQNRAEDEDWEDAIQLTKAFGCDPQACQLPDCRCSDVVLDPSIPIERTPQVRSK